MSRSSNANAVVPPGVWLIVYVGVAAVCAELITRLLPGSAPLRSMGLLRFTAASAVVLVAILGLHLLAGWAVATGLGRVGPRVGRAAWLILAGLFGLSWQETIAHNDGLARASGFPFVHAALLVGAVGGLVGLTWVLWLWRRPPLWLKRALAAAILTAGSAFSLFALPEYRAFHGHLVVFDGVLAVGLIRPLIEGRAGRWLAVGLVAVTVVAAATLADSARHLQRMLDEHSRYPSAVLRASPLDRWLRPPLFLTVEPDVAMAETDAAELRGLVLSRPPAAHPARGRNVLLIVLESVRWDLWGDPAVTPQYARWSQDGVTLPYGISPYPATPLAYGAMFTSQPPSVLTASPYWGRSRLFDPLADRFDRVLLPPPRNHWFGQRTILGFFVAPDAKVHEHRDVEGALAWTRAGIAAAPSDESFFAWVHIYEPHAPYKRHRGHDFGPGKRNAYKSELAYVDAALGEFMDWFRARPDAAETLVLLVADHGQALGETVRGQPFWGHHVHVHNLLSRVPFFAAGPGLPRGRASDQAIGSLLDVMPTIYDFKGLPLPARHLAQGRSLYELLREPAPRSLVTEAFSLRGQAFFDAVHDTESATPAEARKRFAALNAFSKYSPKVGLQHGRDKIVFDRTTGEGWLYDVVDDPMQDHDLRAQQPRRFAAMAERLATWVAAQGQIVRRLDETFVAAGPEVAPPAVPASPLLPVTTKAR